MTSGQKIKCRREELGLSQNQLAERMGYKHKTSISKAESDRNELNSKTLKKFADALRCNPVDLMTDYDDIMANANTDLMIKVALNEDSSKFFDLFTSLEQRHQEDILKQMQYYKFLENEEKG